MACTAPILLNAGDVDSAFDRAINQVDGTFQSANAYASQAFSSALSLLSGLAGSVDGLSGDTSIPFGFPDTAIGFFAKPASPAEPPLDFNFPNAPQAPSLGTVSPFTPGAAPEFNEASPTLKDIAPPAPFSEAAPLKPALSTVALPLEPDFVLPSVPALRDIGLPEVPQVTLPTFQATAPIEPEAPEVVFAWQEEAYTSALLSSMNERLLAFVGGASTGLATDVEQAIWDRAREREEAIIARTRDDLARYFSARGFELPAGALAERLAQADKEHRDRLSAHSREVMVKQADLEQSNFQFAFKTALDLENRLISHAENLAQRAFEAERFAQEAVIQIFNARVSLFNAKSSHYAVEAEVYKARIEAEMSKVELFKAQLEGAKLIGELNVQDVTIYRERINAVLALFELYKSRLEAVKVQQETDRLAIERFKAEVDAFGVLASAKATEYQGFESQVKAEGIKADTYKSLAQAFSAKVEGYKALTDAQVKAVDSQVKVTQEVPLRQFEVLSGAFKAQVDGEAAKLQALNDLYRTRATVFGEEVKAESAKIDGQVEKLKAEVDLAQAEAQTRIEEAKLAVQKAVEAARLAANTQSSGSQVAAQLAAAALSAINVNASVSASGSGSESISQSSSTARNCNESFSDADSTSTIHQHIYSHDG